MGDPTFDRLGIWNWERENIDDEIQYAIYAEEKGFDTVWQGESRLVRDAMTVMGAYSQVTESIKFGPGVTNCYTRNVALMAQTFSTLDELSDGRAMLGIGAWWDPLAKQVGIDRESPLRYMWEYCTVLKKLLDLENVTYDGQFIQVEDIELDLVRANADPRTVPIYIGATGLTMNKMAGELAAKGVVDGVYMNYIIPPEHNEKAMAKLEEGAQKQGGSIEDVDRPQLIAVSMDEDRDVAIDTARGLVTQYIGQQPHITKASGIAPEVGEQIGEELGGWPANAEDIERASRLVPDEVVTNVVAAGTPEDCVQKVAEYCETGCTEPSLYSLGPNVEEVIDVFAEFKAA
ncbi:LLM class flavin-dependent oxidoreductase [Natronorubrum halophilum]|uniref:LLM class flavin-dependent oxidoreductase n=1 Tax=Natronorubrum halophilum TaxID=1702106 RepID=UPI000EF65CD9|nr:LLM class flavin-dependent oxidoreductase [Natronorubrum halophilum]